MEYIREWLKTIFYMNILLLLCDNLVKGTAYEKYYRFFSGFLLMLCLIKPAVDFSDAGKFFDASFLQNELKNELSLVGDSGDFQEMKETIQENYEISCKSQIKEMAQSCGIRAEEISLRWENRNNQDGTLKEITVKGRLETDDPPEENLDEAQDQDGTQAEEAAREEERETQEAALEEVLAKAYGLEQSDIFVEVEE